MARSSRSSAKNHPVTRVKSRRVDRAAKALMEDFKRTDLENSGARSGPADIFTSGHGTPTQEAAARGAFKKLSENITTALGMAGGGVPAVNLGDGLINPATGQPMFGRRK